MIIYDQQNSRMLDTENGDYMRWLLRGDRRDNEWDYLIFDKHDQLLLGAVVTSYAINDEVGRAKLIRGILYQAWVTTNPAAPRTYINGDHPQLPRLVAFLEELKCGWDSKLRFEFADERS